MRWLKLLVQLIAAGIVVWAIGAVVSLLADGLLESQNATAALVTLVVVALAVVGMAAVGAKNKRWLANPPSYW